MFIVTLKRFEPSLREKERSTNNDDDDDDDDVDDDDDTDWSAFPLWDKYSLDTSEGSETKYLRVEATKAAVA